jgi:hypothetical protein
MHSSAMASMSMRWILGIANGFMSAGVTNATSLLRTPLERGCFVTFHDGILLESMSAVGRMRRVAT